MSNDAIIHDISAEQLSDQKAGTLFKEAEQQAISSGTEHYQLLKSQYTKDLMLENEKSDYAFSARRRAVERVGLPEVKAYRVKILEQEIEQWKTAFKQKQETTPELTALLVLKISPAGMDTRSKSS